LTERAVDRASLRIKKWREETQKQKLLKKASEKPAFKCGLVHHKAGSPHCNDISELRV
jgi:hypothetical protein